MIKKIYFMLLIGIMSVFLGACGSNDISKNVDTQKTEIETNEHNEDNIQLSEPFVIVDDEMLTASVTQFYKENNDCHIVIKVRNNSERDMLFKFMEAYLEYEAVRIVLMDGNKAPAPGKSGYYTYKLQYDTKPEATSIDDLNQLYDLEGVIEISVFTEDGEYIDFDNEYRFSLKNE